ncbi:formyltetrahydrofolate deformylase, partial [Escherichia coli]
QQFGDEETGRFFLRVHFDLPAGAAPDALRARLDEMADEYDMDLQLHDARRKERLLIMVSKQGHCLNDLLFRVHSGQL